MTDKNQTQSNIVYYALLSGLLFVLLSLVYVIYAFFAMMNLTVNKPIPMTAVSADFQQIKYDLGSQGSIQPRVFIKTTDINFRAKPNEDFKKNWNKDETIYFIETGQALLPFMNKEWICLSNKFTVRNCAEIL